jgi:plastocyanin
MRSWTSCALVALLGSMLVGCASNADTGFPDPSEVPSDEPGVSCSEVTDEPVALDGDVLVLDSCFAPKVATVAAGTEIHWVQESALPHTVTFVDTDLNSHPDCSQADVTGCMADGDEFSASLIDPGEYPYYCVIHGTATGSGMAATIIVE